MRRRRRRPATHHVSLGFALRIVEVEGARRVSAVVFRDVGGLVRKKTLTVCTLRVVAAKHDIGPDGVAIGVDGRADRAATAS